MIRDQKPKKEKKEIEELPYNKKCPLIKEKQKRQNRKERKRERSRRGLHWEKP